MTPPTLLEYSPGSPIPTRGDVVPPGVQLVPFAQLVTPDGTYSSGYIGVRIEHPPPNAIRFEMIRYPEGRLVTFWPRNLRTEPDGSYILPYQITGPLGTRRVRVLAWITNPPGFGGENKVELLSDTRLLDLPTWTEVTR